MNLKNKILFKIFTVLFIFQSLYLAPSLALSRSENPKLKALVIDPGHGGWDTGAKGSSGLLEKDVSLTFARILQEAEEDGYKIILTRTEDYNIDIYERTAIANHIEADIFISIHTGAGFSYSADRIDMFYFEPQADIEKKISSDTSWDSVQKKHIKESKKLAGFIKSALGSFGEEIALHGAEINVLAGADMPAVLINMGYITNLSKEKRLNNSDYLRQAADAVLKGIENFFKYYKNDN